MSKEPILTTLSSIKRRAKSIKRELQMQHARALDAAAQEAGFQNFRHAQNLLKQSHQTAAQPLTHVPESGGRPTPPPATQPTRAAARRPFSSMYVENLRERIESNQQTLEALREGRITGMGYGPGLSDPGSVAIEIKRLERRVEEDTALLRMQKAKDRVDKAHWEGVFPQWMPHGNGAPTLESLAALDVARADFRAAKAEVDRIAQEIRSGLR